LKKNFQNCRNPLKTKKLALIGTLENYFARCVDFLTTSSDKNGLLTWLIIKLAKLIEIKKKLIKNNFIIVDRFTKY